MYHRSVLLMALVVSISGVSAGQWYGGYGPVQPPTPGRGTGGFRGDYYQDKGSAFDNSPGTAVHGVPSTQGYRFREMESKAPPANNLPKYRPGSFGGRSPYAWGSPSGQWPEAYKGPAPVFRPLEPQEREKSQNQDLRNRYDRFGYQGLTPYEQADHEPGGPEYYPESAWTPQW